MRPLFLYRLIIIAVILPGASNLTAAKAQAPASVPPATTLPSQPQPLTPDDQARMKKVRDQVLATNPALQAEEADLAKKRVEIKTQGAAMPADQRKAITAEGHAHQRKLKAAMLAVDPSLAPLFDQEDAWRKAKHAAAKTSSPQPPQ